jgi:hypothetical protein
MKRWNSSEAFAWILGRRLTTLGHRAASSLLCRRLVANLQGDQIGRIFTQWAIVYFGLLLITEVALNFGQLFWYSNNFVLKVTKMSLATFWAIFSQTHLVTLLHNFRTYCSFPGRLRLLDFLMSWLSCESVDKTIGKFLRVPKNVSTSCLACLENWARFDEAEKFEIRSIFFLKLGQIQRRSD